jgi:hypothetical protein
MNEDQVIRIVATKGPIIPIQVVREVGGNTMFAGAILSQLVDKKRVFVSSVKVGGSPLYYIRGQEHRLQEFSKYLNEKDRQTYELLKQKKILRDNEQSPLVRVSLRSIKDFAVPLEVKFGEQSEIFWKWYLLNEESARELIGACLNIGRKIREEKKLEEKKVEREADRQLQNFVEEKAEVRPGETAKDIKKEESPVVVKEEKIATNDAFAAKIIDFLKRREIIIKRLETKKKNSELDMILLIPSSVGNIEYYCNAKNKKRITDSDISSVYVQGQLKKLPAMLLTAGDLTSKARELLSRDVKVSILKM